MPNICLQTDSYKFSHWKQYPPKTTGVYSYFESRKGATFPYTVFFGLQYILKKHLTGQVVTRQKIKQAKSLVDQHVGPGVFPEDKWAYILENHGGYLPVLIKAVPEGTCVPTGNVLMTIENLDSKCYWLVNYLETLLTQVWYPCTVATQSREMKQLILDSLNQTGDPSLIDFKLHDFGYRGVTCEEQAGIGGAAHLVNFKGTDTFAGIMLAKDYYACEMAGFSIPASEHSTITSWATDGEQGELDAMQNMLQQYPNGLVACVSDSYDLKRACSEYWGGALKDQVLARDGCLVVRPDSGYPPTSVLSVMNILAEKFGVMVNEKGYKVLNPKVRVIQGDGIDIDMLQKILGHLTAFNYSTDNIAFGSGGGLLQKVNRDTQRFAFKCSAINFGNIKDSDNWKDVYKNPRTDPSKASKRGLLELVKNELTNEYKTVRFGEIDEKDQLRTVFMYGGLMSLDNLETIRQRAAIK